MTPLFQYPAEDALNDALAHTHVCGAVYCRSDLRAPWAFSVVQRPVAGFHIIVRGGGWLELDDGPDKTSVAAGDLIILPHGHGHVMRDNPKTRPTPLDEIVAGNPLEDGIRLNMSGRGAATVLLCGGFEVEGRNTNPLLSHLPKLIHIQGRNGKAVSWLRNTVRQIEEETRISRPGVQTVVARLSEVLFVQAMRAYFHEGGANGHTAAWVSALKDPPVGMAIALIHRKPEADWEVGSLAAQVGLSRSSFSARFTGAVGEPPLKYLTRWRVHKASCLLRTSDAKLADIAERVGYQSEFALNRAFKRLTGLTPGAYRYAQRGGIATVSD